MHKILAIFLALSCCSLAYEYHDFVTESAYHLPTAPSDTLVDDCSSLSVSSTICATIRNDSLTTEQNKQLILESLNPDLDYPDYDFVDSWNGNLTFTKYPPVGTETYSSGSIRDAWIKIVNLWPSVQLNNQTLLNRTGKIQTGFNFTFVVPDGTVAGDCRTVYLPQGYNYALQTTLDGGGLNQTNGNANFTLNQTANLFESSLNIESAYQIRHYVWVTVCSPSGCSTTCDYSRTEQVINNLDISDRKEAERYNFTFNASYIVDNNLNGVFDYWLGYNVPDDFAEAVFQGNNSIIRSQGVKYSLVYANPPYNTLSFEATRTANSTSIYGISIQQNNQSESGSRFTTKTEFLMPEATDCTMTFQSHFQTFIIPNFCNSSNETPTLNLSLINQTNETLTIKVHFFDNESNLSNKTIIIQYSGYETTAITNISGEAVVSLPYLNGNQIVKASFQTDFLTKNTQTILVIPEQKFDFGETIIYPAILLILVFLFAKIIMRSIGYAE